MNKLFVIEEWCHGKWVPSVLWARPDLQGVLNLFKDHPFFFLHNRQIRRVVTREEAERIYAENLGLLTKVDLDAIEWLEVAQ